MNALELENFRHDLDLKFLDEKMDPPFGKKLKKVCHLQSHSKCDFLPSLKMRLFRQSLRATLSKI